MTQIYQHGDYGPSLFVLHHIFFRESILLLRLYKQVRVDGLMTISVGSDILLFRGTHSESLCSLFYFLSTPEVCNFTSMHLILC